MTFKIQVIWAYLHADPEKKGRTPKKENKIKAEKEKLNWAGDGPKKGEEIETECPRGRWLTFKSQLCPFPTEQL